MYDFDNIKNGYYRFLEKYAKDGIIPTKRNNFRLDSIKLKPVFRKTINNNAGFDKLPGEETIGRVLYELDAFKAKPINLPNKYYVLDLIVEIIETVSILMSLVDNRYSEDVKQYYNTLHVQQNEILVHLFKVYSHNNDIKKENYDFSSFKSILAYISEDKSNNEKIISYINGCFTYLLYQYVSKNFRDEEIEKILKQVEYANYQKREESLLLHADTIEKKRRFLKELDIDGWIPIITKFNNFKNKISNRDMNFCSYRLKEYRNFVQHNYVSQMNTEYVIGTIYTILFFARKAGFDRESVLLERRMRFEMDRLYSVRKPQKYCDVTFVFDDFYDVQDIPCWKDCVYLIDGQVSDKLLEARIEDLTNLFFAKTDWCQKEAIGGIQEYFKSRKVMYPVDFDIKVEDTYPFHPAFFEIAKALKIEKQELFRIIQNIIMKDYSDSLYNNILIMPYELITEKDVSSLMDSLVRDFSYIEIKEGEEIKHEYEAGWQFVCDVLFDSNSPVLQKFYASIGQNYNQENVVNILKTILLLDHAKRMGVSVMSATKEWILLCMSCPSANLIDVETVIRLSPICLPMFISYDGNCEFSFIRPIDERTYLNQLFDTEASIRKECLSEKDEKKREIDEIIEAFKMVMMEKQSVNETKLNSDIQEIYDKFEESYKFKARYEAYVLCKSHSISK